MTDDIKIEVDRQNHGQWIRIFLPFFSQKASTAIIRDEAGQTLMQVSLSQGHNALDLSGISETVVFLKIETEYETAFRRIAL